MTASRDRVTASTQSAGTIRFGDGVRGMVPAAGRSIQVAALRAGGGAAGNLPAGAISAISVPAGGPRLKVAQPLPSVGGADAETLPEAETRIPATIQNGGRAVTAADYQELAMRTPGILLGRVEVLPRFKPQQRETDVPGVVSVMVLPVKSGVAAPAPRADRSTLESVYAWVDGRRPLAMSWRRGALRLISFAAVEVVTQSARHGAAAETAIRLHLWAALGGGRVTLGRTSTTSGRSRHACPAYRLPRCICSWRSRETLFGGWCRQIPPAGCGSRCWLGCRIGVLAVVEHQCGDVASGSSAAGGVAVNRAEVLMDANGPRIGRSPIIVQAQRGRCRQSEGGQINACAPVIATGRASTDRE